MPSLTPLPYVLDVALPSISHDPPFAVFPACLCAGHPRIVFSMLVLARQHDRACDSMRIAADGIISVSRGISRTLSLLRPLLYQHSYGVNDGDSMYSHSTGSAGQHPWSCIYRSVDLGLTFIFAHV